MLAAFEKANALEPNNKDFSWRHAQAFHDVLLPDPKEALKAWEALETTASSQAEKDSIALHQAYWLLELRKVATARSRLSSIQTPSLKETRDQLWQQIHLI